MDDANEYREPSDQVKVAPRIFNYHLSICSIVFEVKSAVIEEAKVNSVTSVFGDCWRA